MLSNISANWTTSSPFPVINALKLPVWSLRHSNLLGLPREGGEVTFIWVCVALCHLFSWKCVQIDRERRLSAWLYASASPLCVGLLSCLERDIPFSLLPHSRLPLSFLTNSQELASGLLYTPPPPAGKVPLQWALSQSTPLKYTRPATRHTLLS